MSDDFGRCQEYVVNPAAVARATGRLPASENLTRLSAIYQVLGESNRLKILFSLYEEELCVCELGEVLGMSAPAVSHHLRRMKDLGVVRPRRDGKMVYYSLDDQHIRELLDTGLAHVQHR